MRVYVPTYYPNQLITIPVYTRGAQRIYICVYKVSNRDTMYFSSAPTINDSTVFNVKIPKIPKEGVMVEIHNVRNGHVYFDAEGRIAQDPTFAIGKPEIKNLIIPIQYIQDENARRFALFCDDFCEDAGEIPAMNKVYISRDRKFRIDYKEVIWDDNPESKTYGQELTTPARVNEVTKIIEVSKKYFKPYTVPGRKFTLWHEWSHVYKNVNPSDEFEADKNAAFMYLGTGNPKLEASRVAYKIFYSSPHNLNIARYNKIRDYIDNYQDNL